MTRYPGFAALIMLAVLAAPPSARGEASELRVSKGFGIHYLPLYIMEGQKLVEKHAARAGLGDVKVSYRLIDGGNVINDAMLSGALDIASIGVPGFLTLWDKARAIAGREVIGLSGVGGGSVWLMTRNPNVKTLADFTDKDRIAVPGIKTSFVAVVLQMAAAQAFGPENYAKLDHLTVGIPHPDALAAMLAGRTEITAHFCSPPFSYIEQDTPGIRRVINSADVLGALTIIMAYTTRKFADANPKLAQAFVAALDEATTFIAANKREAARIYIDLAATKPKEDEMMRMLNDPDTHYTVAPEGVMKYADFMHRIGTLKAKPASWKDVFFAAVHDRPGS
ncbi:MAG TPA: ABC transporter substrate-binding protein [Xanthobacteraceae bacterium]|nr:ABC transporter substrate-binding protein [Xanthobacteraceae bacterium]